MFGSKKKFLDQADAINIYFADAAMLFAIENNREAEIAALTAAKVAASIQRKGMVNYLVLSSSTLEDHNKRASDRLLGLVTAIEQKDWSIRDIISAKQDLYSVNSIMGKALDEADGTFFQNNYESFFRKYENGDFFKTEEKSDVPKTKMTQAIKNSEAMEISEADILTGTKAISKDIETKVILTPNRAYYNRSFIVHYEVEVGETVSAGELILRIVDPDETIGITASRDSVLKRIFIRNGERVDRSQVKVCEIIEELDTPHKESDSSWKHLDENNYKKMKSVKTKNNTDIEGRLLKLRDLYKKKLISKKIYEERQSEIVKDL